MHSATGCLNCGTLEEKLTTTFFFSHSKNFISKTSNYVGIWKLIFQNVTKSHKMAILGALKIILKHCAVVEVFWYCYCIILYFLSSSKGTLHMQRHTHTQKPRDLHSLELCESSSRSSLFLVYYSQWKLFLPKAYLQYGKFLLSIKSPFLVLLGV